MKKVLVVGNGGRENAIRRALKGCEVLQYNAKTNAEILAYAQANQVDLTIVGAEEKLVDGIWDEFNAAGMKLFGPGQQAARLEGSKAYAKEFMRKYGVKTARYETHNNAEAALQALAHFELPVVVKASGLAAGKGVLICHSTEEAQAAIQSILVDQNFGAAGRQVVIEEYLEGKEASILAFANEQAIVPLVSAKDHKKIGEGETGLNTGGMGTFCPNPFYTDRRAEEFERDILQPTLRGIQAEGLVFAGIIFFGLMLTEKGTYLLEYNMRFGDPETQVVLPMMNEDLLEVIEKCMDRTLCPADVSHKAGVQLCLVLASGGYPQSYQTGFPITGLEGVDYLEAGVEYVGGKPYTAGGRVLNLLGWGKTIAEAQRVVYSAAEKVQFTGKTYRKDIGNDAL